MIHTDNIVAMDRGDQPPVLYDGCTVWACYWIDREGSTLEVFMDGRTGKDPYLAVGKADVDLINLAHRFPINDVIDVLRSAGYEVKTP